MSILVAWPDKPVAMPAQSLVTEHLALSLGKIIALGTRFLRRPGRMLSVLRETTFQQQSFPPPMSGKRKPNP